MKIGFNPGSIVDTNGAPLQGRVLVFVHDSLEKKLVYIMDGSEYVPTSNPVLLDTTGRIPTTLFFDVGVVDVLVQKYVGEPGHLADESPDEDFEDFDRFEAGFDFDPDKESMQTVETIADLKDIENPSGVVRVNCYTTPGDTFPRFYLWNPNYTTSEDGGCVIADTHDASGMWCYLCEGDSIKSSVYGVTAGVDETNISNFCNAPLSVIGTYTVTYPTKLYFEQGTYNNTPSSLTISNSRIAVFSSSAMFTTTKFNLEKVDVDGYVDVNNGKYIADFNITLTKRFSSVVRSSWFRTMYKFWSCHAGKLILDGFHLSSDSIPYTVYIENTVVEGNANTTQYAFSAGTSLHFSRCTFVGGKIFSVSDYLKFSGCNFSESLFRDAGTIDFGDIPSHHVNLVDWRIEDADNPNNYIKWAKATNQDIIDLCGHTVNIGVNSFSYIKNGTVIGAVLCNSNIVIDGITGNPEIAANTPGNTLTVKNSVVSIGNSVFSSVTCVNSNIGNFDADTSTTALSVVGGSFSGIIKCPGWDSASGTHTRGKAVSFRDCVLSIENSSYFDNVSMKGCTINNPIHVIPYYENSDLWLDAIFVGNTFGDNGYIAFGDSSVGNADIYNVKVKNLIIKDNLFYTIGNGVMMPFYSNNASEPYIAPLQEVNATYSGNIGSCPDEYINYGPHNMQLLYTIDQGTYKRSNGVFRVWNLSKYAVFEHGVGLQIAADNTQSKFFTPYLYHERSVENAGDQFDVFIAVKSDDYIATSIIKAFDK